MPPKSFSVRIFTSLIAVGAAFSVAGCSMDDVEFNGGIFNAVGMGGNAKKAGQPQLAERAPLVVPPTLDRLPAPGSAPEQPQLADINDPDVAKKRSQAELEAQQKAYCDKNYRDAGIRGDEVAHIEGPLGPCRKSVLTAIQKWNSADE